MKLIGSSLLLKIVLCKKQQASYLQLVTIFRLVLFDVKIHMLQDLIFRVEVREVILYLLLIDL